MIPSRNTGTLSDLVDCTPGEPDRDTSAPAPPIEIARAIGGSVFVSDWVRAAARRHGVRCQPLSADILAGTGSPLSSAEIRLDIIGQLLLALAGQGVITEQQRAALQAAYLRQVD